MLLITSAALTALMLNALNESRISSWPTQEFSLHWWVIAFRSNPIRAVLLDSATIATGAMLIASVLRSPVTFALSGYDFFGEGTVNLLIV